MRGVFETLDSLAAFPERAPERAEVIPPVRLLRHRAHVIVYRIEADFIAVIRVAHMRRNWSALLNEGAE